MAADDGIGLTWYGRAPEWMGRTGRSARSRAALVLLVMAMAGEAPFTAQSAGAQSAGAELTGTRSAGPDPATLVAAQDLVLTLGLERQLNVIIDLVAKGRSSPDPGDVTRARFLEVLATKLPLVRQETALVYAKRFTAAELIALTAFFRAGPGAKFLDANADLQHEATLIGLRFAREALSDAERASK